MIKRLRKQMSILKIIQSISSCIVSILGLSVLTGWYINSVSLTQILPSFAPMQFNTALGFLLLGAQSQLLNLNKRKIARVLGFMVTLLGITTLLQYLINIDFNIDQIFMLAGTTPKTSHLGRMSPNTALCFALCGLIPFFSQEVSKFKTIIKQFVSTLVLALVLTTLTGYLIGVESVYGWSDLTRMALHTSIGFLIYILPYHLPYLFTRLDREKRLSYQHQQITLLSTCFTVLLLLYLAIATHEEKKFSIKSTERLDLIGDQIEQLIKDKIDSLSLMVERLEWFDKHQTLNREYWTFESKSELKHDSAFQAVRVFGENMELIFNKSSPGHLPEQMKPSNLEDIRKKMAIERESLITQFKAHSLLIIVPMKSRSGLFGGFVIKDMSIDRILNPIFKRFDLGANRLEIRHKDKLLYQFSGLKQDHEVDNFRATSRTIKCHEHSWVLTIYPAKKVVAEEKQISFYLVFFGLIIIFVFLKLLTQEQIARQSELRANEARLMTKTLFDAAADCIVNFNSDLLIITMNFSGLKLLEYSLDEIQGKNISMLFTTDEWAKDIKTYKAQIDSSKDNKLHSAVKVGLRNKNGMEIPGSLTLGHAENRSGLVFTAIIRDNSLQNQLDRDILSHRRELEELNQSLAASNQELQRFAYVTSHDLKAPLRGIMTLADFIEEEINDEQIKDESVRKENISKHLLRVRGQITRMKSLIAGILEYSQVGRTAINLSSVDTNTLIAEITEDHNENRNIRFEMVEKLPIFTTDRTKLSQIFSNLISNAIKYHHQPSDIIITIGHQKIDNMLEFSVSDNGPGIEERFHTKIFEIFKTLQPRDQVESTGIGLSIVQKLVVFHGGSISVDSRIGQGSTFRFTWPIEINVIK